MGLQVCRARLVIGSRLSTECDTIQSNRFNALGACAACYGCAPNLAQATQWELFWEGVDANAARGSEVAGVVGRGQSTLRCSFAGV